MAKKIDNKIFILLSELLDFKEFRYGFESWWTQKPTKAEIENIIYVKHKDVTEEEYKNLFKGDPVNIGGSGIGYIVREMEPNTIIRTKMYHEDEDRIILSRNLIDIREHHG